MGGPVFSWTRRLLRGKASQTYWGGLTAVHCSRLSTGSMVRVGRQCCGWHGLHGRSSADGVLQRMQLHHHELATPGHLLAQGPSRGPTSDENQALFAELSRVLPTVLCQKAQLQ